MRRLSQIALLCIALCAAIYSHAANADISFEKQVLLASIQNRESEERGTALYVRVDTEISGPAAGFIVPGARKGDSYRQTNSYEWWVRDQQVAVATLRKSSSTLDGVKIVSTEEEEGIGFVYTYDGSRNYLLDFRQDGAVLEIGTKWPYAGSACPPLFGRAYNSTPYSELMSSGFDLVRTESLKGSACQVVDIPISDHAFVRSWLSPENDYLSVKEEYHTASGVAITREYEFSRDGSGPLLPVGAVEIFRAARGNELRTDWRFTAAKTDPQLPAYIFTPPSSLATVVIDRLAGNSGEN